jgi:hypothetical protein
MKKIFVLSICLFIVVSCRTTETTNNSGTYTANQKPSQEEMDAAIDNIMNNENLDEFTKKLMIEIVTKAKESPETLVSDLQKGMDNMLYVYPNPTSGPVTVEFARDFPFKSADKTLKYLVLDLYYMGEKINTLEFSNIKDNKVVISSDYIQKEGTYTIVIPELNISNSFMVKK